MSAFSVHRLMAKIFINVTYKSCNQRLFFFFETQKGRPPEFSGHPNLKLELSTTIQVKAIEGEKIEVDISLNELVVDRRLSEATHDAWVWSGTSFTAWGAY